ncbi:MAG: (Fe-S)-binding protein [Desulfobacterales bacterium]|jgi:glycolate oxidase iron-sulfur subunit|nr:(Fe-S)-binding protein [Desulfobacteraceae bacterium]MBT7086880.1 (Fe-S)-binding protein [Desulfobacterales bacterium]
MQEIKELTKLINELDSQVSACTRCGVCQGSCPVFFETGREADVTRGKLALIDGLVKEMFGDPKGVYSRLNKCLLCGSCVVNCPSGINSLEIFIKARVILTGYMGLSGIKKIILRFVLGRPVFFNRIMGFVSGYQRYFSRPVDKYIGTSCARFGIPLFKDRHFKSLASVPFHDRIPSVDKPSGSSNIKVAFFVGCIIDKVFPEIAESALKIFEYHGIGVFMPEGEGCCGIPAISSGDTKTFNSLVLHNIERFDAGKFDYLITACATCTYTIKKIWPMMFQAESDETKEKIIKLSEKTLDINQFLVSEVGLVKENETMDDDPISITYHDPCHLKKSMGVFTEPRELIEANNRYRLKEMREADRCCGMGGSFNLSHYDISSEIGKRKRDNIAASNCSIVATGCPACMIHISDMLSKSGDKVLIKHTIEIYAEVISKKLKAISK